MEGLPLCCVTKGGFAINTGMWAQWWDTVWLGRFCGDELQLRDISLDLKAPLEVPVLAKFIFRKCSKINTHREKYHHEPTKKVGPRTSSPWKQAYPLSIFLSFFFSSQYSVACGLYYHNIYTTCFILVAVGGSKNNLFCLPDLSRLFVFGKRCRVVRTGHCKVQGYWTGDVSRLRKAVRRMPPMALESQSMSRPLADL